jgi:methylmalonyl-CoA/ethylmalonyl-CoA epimerase
MGVRAPLTITEVTGLISHWGAATERLLGKTSRMMPAVGLLRIDHVGVAVPDLDAALAFYAETFGLHAVHEEVNEDQGVREAMLAVGPDTDGPRIQLLAPISPDSAIAKFIDRSGPGLQQLAYTVADVEQTSAALRDRGLRLLYDTPRRGTGGSLINFVHPKDAGGVLVELVQPA